MGNAEVAARYDVREELGRGGVAVVYRAIDRVTREEVALKVSRQFEDPGQAREADRFLEREYHALAQLSHPNVVKVYDYVTGTDGAFYTMEYLLGDDLHLAAPMGYREACALLRDVCSALCLVHSRRFVHRDVSPRNVLRVGAMRAKLIDFGALSPMGPSRQIVGTPPFCPPEVLHREPLDARADLYSLGATLYYALCGRNAYPARDFRSLRRLWESPPRAPSQLAQSIPATLDALVMELIQLDPSERPDSAAEVMLRLTSIAGLPVSEQVTVSGAYLVTPNLVGRDHFLTRFRRRLRRAQQGHGRALSVTADRGLGRTRALDACALEVKLAGGSLARADCLDAQQGDYGVARALCQQLFELHPQAAHRAAAADAALLATVVPELAAGSREHPSEPATNPGCQREAAEEPGRSLAPSRADLQRALRDFLLTLCAHRPLALVVDDVDRSTSRRPPCWPCWPPLRRSIA